MIVDETEVEIKKFKMFAEKADSESKIIDLCKKYLKHKGIDVDKGFAEHFKPVEPQKIYVGMMDIVPVRAELKIDGLDMSPLQTSKEMIYAKRCVVDDITHQLVLNDMIAFSTYQKMDTYQTIIQAKLNVWKEPNVKR